MSKRISGAVCYSKECHAWYIHRTEKFNRTEKYSVLWKNGTWHDTTGYEDIYSLNYLKAPGWYKTRKKAREVLKKYKENVHVCVVMDESSIITKKMIEKCKGV